MVRPLREYLKLEGISVFSFSKRINTSHQNVANWLRDPETLCYVQFDVASGKISKVTRQKHTVLFDEAVA
jgi:hypothetical protein